MVWSTYSSSSTLSGVLSIHFTNIKNYRVQFQGILIIELWAAGWDARKLPLCYPPPTHTHTSHKGVWNKFQLDLHLSQLFDNVIVVCRGSAQGYVTVAIHVLGGWVHADVCSKLQRALRRNTFVCWQLSWMALWLRLDLMSVLKLTLIRLVQPMK